LAKRGQRPKILEMIFSGRITVAGMDNANWVKRSPKQRRNRLRNAKETLWGALDD
jgi:hypothetical protein